MSLEKYKHLSEWKKIEIPYFVNYRFRRIIIEKNLDTYLYVELEELNNNLWGIHYGYSYNAHKPIQFDKITNILYNEFKRDFISLEEVYKINNIINRITKNLAFI